ncbi:MAG: hypothetical protein LBO66_11750 [Deltaproteobacteria bacterium]|jgi:signal transduction histidine kinase|nr:hypothetical protein [Deltaproteobacteria bacterium]
MSFWKKLSPSASGESAPQEGAPPNLVESAVGRPGAAPAGAAAPEEFQADASRELSELSELGGTARPLGGAGGDAPGDGVGKLDPAPREGEGERDGGALPQNGAGRPSKAKRSPYDQEKQFRLAKYFSSVSILVIFASCLLIAAVMSGEAEDIIYERVVEDSIMLMDNLNYQMFHYFLLPIFRERGQAKLSERESYQSLNTVIKNTVFGFDISSVSLYDAVYGMKIYSSDSEIPVVVYLPDPATGELIPKGEYADPLSAYHEAIRLTNLSNAPYEPQPEIDRDLARPSWWPYGEDSRQAYVQSLKARTVVIKQEGSYLLGGFFPHGKFSVRFFKGMRNLYTSNITGVLEITRDVTMEYRQIAAMQFVALLIAVGTTIFLTFVLRLVVARGEAIVTQRNAEKAALNERLNQVERLVSLGRMVATVSHEIRNPLGIINSSADFLKGSLKAESPKLSRLAEAIVDESERLSRIVTDFLDFARPQEPRFAPVVVEDILEEIFVLLEVDLNRGGVELRANLREEPGPIMADGTLLHRAFVNILMNAIQAMPDGGLLTVETRLEDNLAFASGGLGRIVIQITDTGPGIHSEALSSLFKPFFTTKTKGTGLGLVLVRNIVEGHGGRLELRNVETEESGLAVIISLPLSGREL